MTFEFPKLSGVPYIRFLARMHRHLQPDWYLEIGTNKGRSLKKSIGNSIAVDPKFIISADVIGTKNQTHFFQMTSDEFFKGNYASKLCKSIDFAFLDGLHLFEFLLRDFIETEKMSKPNGVIAMHDCVPITYIAAERDWDTKRTKAWTGDVWKLVPILKKYRPDLKIEVLDCPPSGLTIVSNLDPKNDILKRSYDEIVDEFIHLDLAGYGEAALFEKLNIVSSRGYPGNRFVGGTAPEVDTESLPLKNPQKLTSLRIRREQPMSFTIKNPAPNMRRGRFWGETFFANGLANALRRKGHSVTIQRHQQWDEQVAGDSGVNIVLRRPDRPYIPNTRKPLLIWVLYGGGDITASEVEAADHIFVASALGKSLLSRKFSTNKISTLLQAFDADRMSPEGPTENSDVLYVGNHYAKTLRTSVRLAIEHDVNIDLYGRGWANTSADHLMKADHIDNTQLAAYYRGANVVLNDHEHDMGSMGFVSNRIFDALACGTPIVSDYVSGLPEDMDEWVSMYLKEQDFPILVKGAADEGSTRRAHRVAFAERMRGVHSFDQRVNRLIEAARASQQHISRTYVGENV